MSHKQQNNYRQQSKAAMPAGPDLTHRPKIEKAPNYAEASAERNLEVEQLTNRLVEHIEGIDKIREEFEELGEFEYGNCPAAAGASRPWQEQDQERRILRQRHVDKRHQLLSHVLADLLELVSREAGLDQIDKLLYPYNHKPARRVKAFKLA